MDKIRLLHLVIMLMAVLACSRTSAAGFESDAVSCVGISRAEYDEAKLCAAKGANVEIQPADISRELLAVMLEKVAALDLSLYKGCSGNVLLSFEDGRYVDDGEFIIESKCVANHSGILILSFETPVDAYSYFFFMDENYEWNLSPIKIPSRFIALSDDGMIAGVYENNDERYTKIDFFRINNFNTSGTRSITPICRYDSLSDDKSAWSIPYNDGCSVPFWSGGCLYLAGVAPNVADTEDSVSGNHCNGPADVFFLMRSGLLRSGVRD